MHTKQIKTSSSVPSTKAIEVNRKVASNATTLKRIPAWASARGDQLPASLLLPGGGTVPGIQAKLSVSQPGDSYEQEADRIADRVMRTPASSSSQHFCACGGIAGPTGECAACAAKRKALQRKATQQAAVTTAPSLVTDVLNSSSGRPLDAATRSFMEPRFGQDFSNVRVHTDGRAVESAQAVNAKAYTVGSDVVFGAGQYRPGTGEGHWLLAHELTHVIQQQQMSSGVIQRSIKVENPSDALPGSPPKKNWEEIRDYIAALCSSFSVSSSGVVAPSSSGACAAGSGGTACKCMCDLHSSRNPEPWKIKIDDKVWPHTEEGDHRVTVHSTRSAFSFGAWGAGAAATRRIFQDNPRVLGHELCGHAWLMEQGRHPAWAGIVAGGRPSHDPTVAIENIIARERGISAANLRGSFADLPHHGESFGRVTISGFSPGSSNVSSLPLAMQARITTVKDFLMRDRLAILDVIGHADHTGGSAINIRIAKERARNVQSRLIALGIPPGRFRTVDGKSDTECPPAPADNPACRKVDIFVFIMEAASEGFR